MSVGLSATDRREGRETRPTRLSKNRKVIQGTEKASMTADDSTRGRVNASPRPDGEASARSEAATVSARRFSTNVAWTFAARVLMTVNSVGAGVIVARWLGAEGLGALAVVNVAVATVVQLGGFGLPSANTYFIARDERRFLVPAAMNSLLFALVGGGVLAFGLIVLALKQPMLFGYVSPQLIGLAAVSIPFQLLTLLGLNIFLAVGRIDRFNRLDVAGQSFVLVNAALALVLLGAGLWTVVSLNTAATIIVSLVIVWLVVRYIAAGRAGKIEWRPDFGLFRQMMRFGIKFHVSALAALLIFRADLLLVNHFRGAAEAGVYSVASQMAMMLMVLPGVIASLLFPHVASATEERRGVMTCAVTRHTAFIMLVVCLLIVPLSLALPWLYGASFADVPAQLWLLLPGVYLVSIESVLVQYFTGGGLPVLIPFFWVATLAVNIALNIALVPGFGARGAAVASTIAYALIFILVMLYFRLKTDYSISFTLLPRAAELRALFGRRAIKNAVARGPR